MNDNYVIETLKHCSENGECKDCLLNPKKGNYGHCTNGLMKRAIDLIYRQKAEIERLQKQLDSKCDRCIERDRTAAVEEFAEKLKAQIYVGGVHPQPSDEFIVEIDSLVEEMTSGKGGGDKT